MKSTNLKELQKWLKNLLKEEYVDSSDIRQIINDFDFEQQQAGQVEPEVKVQIADILRICEISLPNARLVNANTQYAKGWEDAYKQLIDYINDLKG